MSQDIADARTHGMWVRGACADNAAMKSFFSLLQPASEERPGSSALDQPRATTPGDRRLDREDLPPPPAPRRPRPHDPHRVRDTDPDRSRGLTAPTEPSQLK